MAPFYEELRDVRIAQSLTLEEISKETKIHPRFLHALEGGEFDILPEPYIRLFLKAYAIQIGVDYKVPLAKLDEHLHGTKEAERHDKERHKLRRLQPGRSPKQKAVGGAKSIGKNQVLWFASLAVLFVIVVVLRECRQDKAPSIAEERLTRSAAELLTAEAQNQGREDQDQTSDTLSGEPAPFLPPGEPLTLSMTAVERTWIAVNVDGDRDYDVILRPGQSESWQAGESFRLKLGKTRGVTLSLNGKPLEPLGPQNTWVTEAIITREGIISSETTPILPSRD